MIAPPPQTPPPAAVAPAPAPGPPELWRGALAGMTVQQVQALFPKGRAGAGLGVDGAAPGWAMDEEVYGRPGVATFYFKDGRLAAVLVGLSGVSSTGAHANLATARQLSQALSGYYGKPSRCTDTTQQGLDRLDCRWSGHGLWVGLSYVDFGGRSPTLDLSIRVAPPKWANDKMPFKPKGRRM